MSKINSKNYWNKRFSSGDWEFAGRLQTMEYAKANIKAVGIDENFTGSILDFGCALGDAIPVYAQALPRAKLIGMDFSDSAVAKCRENYGHISSFICGSHDDTPFSDIIIASHVMEHLDNDFEIVKKLIKKCDELYVIVPYEETPLYVEHVNYYDSESYKGLFPISSKVFNVFYRRRLGFVALVKSVIMMRLFSDLYHRKEVIVFRFSRDSNIIP